jgi:hypothetical protein
MGERVMSFDPESETAAPITSRSRDYRLTIEPDQDPDLSWLDQAEFAGEDKSNHELAQFLLERLEECKQCGGRGTRDERVTVKGGHGFVCVACEGDGTIWQVVGSLGGVDYLKSAGGMPELRMEFAVPLGDHAVTFVGLDTYTRSIIVELIDEAEIGL